MCIKPCIMAFLEITANAPTPSTDNMVACSSRSVNVWRTCGTHSQPARVRNACWNGAVAASTASDTCCAIVRATKRRNVSPTTIPRTPPLGFCRAVILPLLMMDKASGGTSLGPRVLVFSLLLCLCQTVDEAKRAARVEMFVHMSEFSSVRQALVGEAEAPGIQATYNQLTDDIRRPARPQDPLPDEILNFQPTVREGPQQVLLA